MDKNLKKKIEEKIEETLANSIEIQTLVKNLSKVEDSEAFIFGIVVGRIYNSFHYQSKRILGREPTPKEFEEFVEYLKNKKSDFKNLW